MVLNQLPGAQSMMRSKQLILGTWQQRRGLSHLFNKINDAGTEITISENLNTLGVTFDQHLSFNNHVQSVSRTCHYHIRALRRIRSLLTHDSAVTVACGIVSSRLDYCNSLLYGSSAENIKKLVRAQNTLARVVTGSRSRTGSTSLLQGLHWLPVDYRIRYKISTLTYKIIQQQQQQPKYQNYYSPDTFHHVLCDQANRCNRSFQETNPESEPEPSVWQHQPSGTVFL